MHSHGQVPHHTVAYDIHLLELGQDVTDLGDGVPAHVAVAGYIGSVEAGAASGGERGEEGVAGGAEGVEGCVQVEGGESAPGFAGKVGEGVGEVGGAGGIVDHGAGAGCVAEVGGGRLRDEVPP